MPLGIRINVTVPKEILNTAAVRRALAHKLSTKTARDLKALFGLTVAGWDNKPVWRQKLTNVAAYISEQVWADGPNANIYGLVSRGSPPHDIPPRNGGWLRFQTGYTPSTRPGFLTSIKSNRFGSMVYASGINNGHFHPGFEARRFPELIAEKYEPEFRKDVQDAIHEAVVEHKFDVFVKTLDTYL